MKEARLGPAVAQTDRQSRPAVAQTSRQEVKLPKISYYVEKFRSGENHELRSIV